MSWLLNSPEDPSKIPIFQIVCSVAPAFAGSVAASSRAANAAEAMLLIFTGSPFRLRNHDARPPQVVRPGSHLPALGEFVIAGELVAIEFHAEARPGWHGHRPVLVLHLAAYNNVIGQMVVVGVRSQHEIRQTCGEVKHGSL